METSELERIVCISYKIESNDTLRASYPAREIYIDLPKYPKRVDYWNWHLTAGGSMLFGAREDDLLEVWNLGWHSQRSLPSAPAFSRSIPDLIEIGDTQYNTERNSLDVLVVLQ